MFKLFINGGVMVFVAAMVAAICVIEFQFIKYKKSQQNRISNLENKVNLLLAEKEKNSVKWNQKNYNYLAVGNSITLHSINDYWWNECGMAATDKKNDFVHIISNALDAQFYAYNFYTWEILGHDRSESLSLLDGFLSKEIDLITIQLGENVSDLCTYESDFRELVEYVQRGAQNAQIVVIGDFWDMEVKDNMKKQACEATGVTFVDLSPIKGLEEYQCGIGVAVYDEEKNRRIVEHCGVAKHPNDKGMKWIADRVLEKVKK